MPSLRIEFDRGNGWEVRNEGTADVTADQVRASLPTYAVSYPHRAWLDGKLVATAAPNRRGSAALTRREVAYALPRSLRRIETRQHVVNLLNRFGR
jgi:hypothetical protein